MIDSPGRSALRCLSGIDLPVARIEIGNGVDRIPDPEGREEMHVCRY